MDTVELPSGALRHRTAGPADATTPVVVFVHGLLVNHELWTGTADALAARGIRSITPDLPLGSHTLARPDGADNSVDGVVGLLLEFLAALDLHDVTLVGNDTGGALCQILVDRDASRVGRLVLTNCDAFDQFPPFPFTALKFGSSPRRARLMMRAAAPRAIRHSVLGFGGLAATPLDPELTARWVRPALDDPAVARDLAAFLRSLDARQLADVSSRLGRFTRPVRLIWGDRDRFFKPAFAERLLGVFPDADLVPVPGGRTFVGLDFPELVAEHVAEFVRGSNRADHPLTG
jgi:pimeloyl-ACP methyl ester carboxylesterase